jgi:hypothetical protein
MGFKKTGYRDEIKWHAEEGRGFPADLPREAAATHMGMFLAWAIHNKLASKRHYDKKSAAVKRLAAKAITPGAYFREVCEEWLTEEDFSERGHAFADAMYDEYLEEYGCMFVDVDTYRAPDTWETYELVTEMLDALLTEWAEDAEPGTAPDRRGM